MSSTAERVKWRGESWVVADARFDESPLGVGSHWHLTLTAPEPGHPAHIDGFGATDA